VVSLDEPDFKKITLRGNILEAGCGVSLSRVIQAAQRNALRGLEFLSGIPGTIGGALAMNAGVARGPGTRRVEIRDIARVVKDVTVMDPGGNVRTLRKKEIRFGYRKSSLSQYLILSSRLKLNKGNKKEIQDRIKGYLDYRRATQDPCWRSAGCVFKNPAHHSAGRLIDLCGLKGKRIGGARVSSVHANFIVNDSGRSSAADILELMALISETVKARFKIELEPEVTIWGS
jgi:UDP-N-acetylmuramate dehydrogenase